MRLQGVALAAMEGEARYPEAGPVLVRGNKRQKKEVFLGETLVLTRREDSFIPDSCMEGGGAHTSLEESKITFPRCFSFGTRDLLCAGWGGGLRCSF